MQCHAVSFHMHDCPLQQRGVVLMLRLHHLQELPGGIPRSVWQWQGGIPRRLFDLVPFYLRESEAAGGCQHCTFVLRYKVLNGQLYTDSKRRWAAWCGGCDSAR